MKNTVGGVNIIVSGGDSVRVAIFGGSFHPPHVGHAMVMQWLLSTDQVDAVWMVPTVSHALGKSLPDYRIRHDWCVALAQSLGSHVRVDDIETSLPTPSFTLTTLRALQSRHPQHTFRLVVGTDILGETADWHRWSDIVSEFSPLIVGRTGYPFEGTPVYFPDISSTMVRRKMANGESVEALVPAVVLAAMGTTR